MESVTLQLLSHLKPFLTQLADKRSISETDNQRYLDTEALLHHLAHDRAALPLAREVANHLLRQEEHLFLFAMKKPVIQTQSNTLADLVAQLRTDTSEKEFTVLQERWNTRQKEGRPHAIENIHNIIQGLLWTTHLVPKDHHPAICLLNLLRWNSRASWGFQAEHFARLPEPPKLQAEDKTILSLEPSFADRVYLFEVDRIQSWPMIPTPEKRQDIVNEYAVLPSDERTDLRWLLLKNHARDYRLNDPVTHRNFFLASLIYDIDAQAANRIFYASQPREDGSFRVLLERNDETKCRCALKQRFETSFSTYLAFYDASFDPSRNQYTFSIPKEDQNDWSPSAYLDDSSAPYISFSTGPHEVPPPESTP